MAARMSATASACASVFSPVSSVSPAIRGSAKARARASMFSTAGAGASRVAADSGMVD